MSTPLVGNKVAWVARGKVARLDGVAGKKVNGVVLGFMDIDGEQYVEVKPSYPSKFKMTSLVPISRVSLVK